MTNTKFKSLFAAAAVSALFALPVVADDTELLLVNPDPSSLPKPNVLFILDTSGSMSSEEETVAPYDPTEEYDGDCKSDLLYWTDTGDKPDCNNSDAKDRAIKKDEFYCQAAATELAGLGSYAGTLAQYRETEGVKIEIWQQLEVNNDSDPVECAADSGKHGDGTAGRVYATALADQKNPWTADPNLEIAWGSAPRNVSYSVYDGNYLNWENNPITIEISRNEIMRTVVTNMLRSVSNMNVGVMCFNNEDGGVVIQSLIDLDDNRQKLIDVVDGLNANGFTPLAETLNEAAQYWLGLNGYYAEKIAEFTTDPAALQGGTGHLYNSPVTDVCAKNYNVLLTDGQPVRDTEAKTLTPNLPGFSSTFEQVDGVGNGRTACTGTAEGDCLDDIAQYLSLADLDPNYPGLQNVTTHTIGFTIDLPLLKDTAELSGGEYFLADDISSLSLALLEIVANINDRSLSFTAPAVSVNSFNRTRNLNRLYLTMFGARPKVHWPGNLKQYLISDNKIIDASGQDAVNPDSGFFYDTATSVWNDGEADGNDVRKGGAATRIPDPADRNLYTNKTGDEDLTSIGNQLTPTNSAEYKAEDFGLTGAASDPTVADMINWMRGEDIRDEDKNPDTTKRNAMGDPLHSQPAAIVYGGTPTDPDLVVYMATNDGYLHAIDGKTGEELWAFVPFDLLPNMSRLYYNPESKYKNYGLDGDVVPIVKDDNKNGIVDGSDFVYLVFGMRRGGSKYFALDVTDRNAPKLMWDETYDNSGQSWSSPVVTRINIDKGGINKDLAVMVVGAGYDPIHDSGPMPADPDARGAGIYFIDVEDGEELWSAALDDADLELGTMTRSIPTAIRVLDVTGDGFADRMYAADMGGQVWRFDIFNGEKDDDLVTGGVIAQLGIEGNGGTTGPDNRRFYNTPDVSLFTDPLQVRRYMAVSIGSGYRSHPFDLSATDNFFSLRDPDPFRQLTQDEYDNYDIIKVDDLINVSGKTKVELKPADRGWRFELPDNQKVLADSVTFNNEVFFVGFSPESQASEGCYAGVGTNYLYRMSIINGDPVVTNLDALDPNDSDEARRDKLAQGGIAPSPTILFPSPTDPDCDGEACSPPPIGCVGVECFDPGFVNNPVRTLWTDNATQ
ncbi:MAG: PilC/PilY family type IV pilus protein [Woeseia sp.]